MLRPFAWVLLIAVAAVSPAAAGRPMKVDDLFAFKRVADPQISPDGKSVVYQVGTVDLEANKTSTNLWLAATDGKTPPRQLTDPTQERPPPALVAGRQARSCSNRPGRATASSG